MLDVKQIKDIIPHRYPFLFVDEILEIDESERAVGIKNIAFNEKYLIEKSKDLFIFPNVLIIEALSQVGAITVLKSSKNRNRLAFFLEINNCKFKREVYPGDQIRLEYETIYLRGPIGKGKVLATVKGEVVCTGIIKFVLGQKRKKND